MSAEVRYPRQPKSSQEVNAAPDRLTSVTKNMNRCQDCNAILNANTERMLLDGSRELFFCPDHYWERLEEGLKRSRLNPFEQALSKDDQP